VQGSNDPIPDYLNDDLSIDYSALGIDPAAAPPLGALNGLWGLESYIDLTTFSDGDDTRVINSDNIAWFGAYDFFYESYGIEI